MHEVESVYAWHGRLMVLAWSLLLPFGILAARFFKVTRQQNWPARLDNKLWWHLHLALQISGVLAMSAGLALVWLSTGATAFGHSVHATLGWLVVGVGWMQLLGGYLRGSKGGPRKLPGGGFDFSHIERGDHYDMSRRRVVFEWGHKLVGYMALGLSVFVTALGLWRVGAPAWMWLLIGLWWCALGVLAMRLQQAGRCIDTYQAIWGPDPRHPGNLRRAIGPGIRREP